MIFMDVDTALSEVPVNLVPLTDDTDFKSIESAVAYNASGMSLYWHFVTSAGSYTATAVTPTTAGTYDWTHQQQGMYTIEIPASGGASINNDTEGYGWFTGVATGVLPWRGPTICFRASAINDSLCDTNTTGLLAPTTAGRTLDVSAGGEAGVDWANVGSPSTTVNLSSTTIKTATDVETDTADIQSRLPAALVSGRIDASVGAMAANVLTATAINTGAITAAKFAAGAIDAAAVASDAWQEMIETCFTYNATADYAGATAGSLVKEIADNAGGSSLTAADIADAVWDELISGHAISGSTGEALSAAGGAGDPWITSLPGSYTSGQAGYIVGTYIDAAISSRAAASVLGAAVGASISADIAAVKTQTAAIETDTQDIQSKIGTPSDLGGGATLGANNADMAGATFSGTTDSLEALRNRGDSAWITATGFSTHSAADVWSSGTRTLTGDVTIADGYITAAKIGTGALTASKFASGAIDAAALATDAAQEIRDSVWAKTFSELTTDPGATPVAADAVMLGFMSIRNKHETDSGGGTDKIFNSAGTAILTATITDAASVFTKAKYA